MRRSHDDYFTPTWATRALLDRVAIHGTVFETCVGAGDIARPLGERCGVTLTTNDLDVKRHADSHGDAQYGRTWHGVREAVGPIDWSISNPPFSYAAPIVKLAHEYSRVGVAMLLRLSFLEPCKGRGEWLAEHPPTQLIVLPRISFTGDGKTDSVTCAWMVWIHDHEGTIDIVPSPRANDLVPSLLEAAC